MKRFFLTCAVGALATVALAQSTSEEDRDWITGLIEDAVSNDEMVVRLSNFEGALSAQATADAITIADPNGVWLRLEGLVFDWDRSSLLAGHVNIQELSAERIELIRLPIATTDSDVDVPAAQATPFSLPDLPVSIDVKEISAAEIILTEDLLGEPITARFDGAVTLDDGAGTTEIVLERRDEKTGRFDISASYENETRHLALSLVAEEGENGIAARMLDLPDRPAIRLSVDGDAPLDDFAAQIALATDGIDRVQGGARLFRPENTQDQAFDLDLSGDLRPLLDDSFDAFFGTQAVLDVEGVALADGGVTLSNLAIRADQLNLSGTATLDAQNWPQVIDITGQLGTEDGTPVILPISGAQTEVSAMSLSLQYDATVSDDWVGAFDITGLTRDGIAIDALTLSGGGIIVPGAGDARGRFSADMSYDARGVALDDTALSEAIGSEIEGTLNLGRLEGEPFVLERFTLSGAGIDANLRAYIDGPEDRFTTRAQMHVTAGDLGRFATLSGMDLAGSGVIDLAGTAQPFDGIFDITMDLATTDLETGIDQADALLVGEAQIVTQIERDTTGTRLRQIDVISNAVTASGMGEITSSGVDATFTANLTELGLVVPELSGPADIQADISTDIEGVVTLDTRLSAPQAWLDIDGTASPIEGGYDVDTLSVLNARDLSAYADLAGQDLAGGATIRFDGTYRTTTGALRADIAIAGRDLEVGIDQVDPLLGGETDLTLSVDHDAEATRISRFDITGDAISANGQGTYADTGATANLVAQIADLGLLAPQLSGPATLNADVVTDAEGVITLGTNLDAPQTNADFDIIATPIDGGYSLSTVGTAAIDELGAYRDLIGQPVSGGFSVDLDGTYNTPTGTLEAQITAQTRDIGIGNTSVDSILAGLGRIDANVGLSETGRLRLDALDVVFPNLSANGNIATSGEDTEANLSVRLRDVGLFTPDFSGPLTADVAAVQDPAGWQVSGTAAGPANTTARLQGRVGNDGILSLGLTGNAPLDLANVYIDPQQINGQASFDLTIDGPPALSSIRGPVTLQNARVSAPTFQQAVENLNGTLQLAGGTVRIDLRGSSAAGGDIALTGPVGLDAPYTAALRAQLSDIVVQDPDLYRALVTGGISVDGPLTGGAAITGTLNLNDVEVQVPSTGVSALGSLPDVTHLGARSAVIRTLDRAGEGPSNDSADTSASTGGIPYPIDILVRAPSKIFIRGRGLDAELGGELRVTGTSNDVIPIGRFDLTRGRLNILGQRFELTEGYAQLEGDFSPYLRLVATTESSTGTEISIIVEGTAEDIDVTFESSPTLPQDEVLAQLLFGRDLADISPLQAVQLASAVATLAGNGNGGVINSFRENLDLDDLDLITDEDGNTAVRAGKYISDNVYTEVTAGSGNTSEISINIDIDRNFTARGTASAEGDTSVGIFFERDY